jgi:adenosylcobinamide amidohydrolase
MYVIIFTTVCFSLNAQNKESVEKSIFNAQIGTVGVWVNNEIRLSDGIAL